MTACDNIRNELSVASLTMKYVRQKRSFITKCDDD